MHRILEQLLGGCPLYTLPQIHHRDLIGDVLHHAQIMRNKEIRQADLLLQVHQEVQNLGLDGHVQRGHRLVADDKLGIHRQCPGDADPLPPAAIQLMGIGILQAGGQANGVHQLTHPLL